MKRVNNLIEPIADMDNLRLAFWKAAKGKRHANAVLKYGEELENNLADLREQILFSDVDVGKYRFFTIYEPKERQICASDFGEQVLHHAIMNICHPYFERAHIYDSYASRKNKGTYAALDRAKKFTRKYAWFLKLDVKKFFASVHHKEVKNQLSHIFKDDRLLDIFEQIVDSYEAKPDRGLPIGNLISQYLANHYLTALDHYIRERLRMGAYIRYMDDMIIWHNQKSVLKAVFQQVEAFIQVKLKCELKPALLNQCKYGLPFLGYRIFPYHTRLNQQSKQRFIHKINKIEKNYINGSWNEDVCQRHVLPLLAFLQHADTKEFRKKLNLHQYGQSS